MAQGSSKYLLPAADDGQTEGLRPQGRGGVGEEGWKELAQRECRWTRRAQYRGGHGPDRPTRGGGAELKGNRGISVSLTNCGTSRAVEGLGSGSSNQIMIPPHAPSELNCLSIKTDAGVCLCMCWGRGGLELVEIMNLGGFVFQVYLRGIFVGHLPTPNHDNNPGKLPIRKDNHLQVFMETGGLE